MSYRPTTQPHHLLRHLALYYVTNLKYLVIANHLSASGLRLAPHLTHALSAQAVGRGAGDMVDKVADSFGGDLPIRNGRQA